MAPTVRHASPRGLWTTVALGYAPPLAVLAGGAAMAFSAARADPAMLALTVATTAAAALSIVAAAARTLSALRRAQRAPAPAAEESRRAMKDAAACALRSGVEIDHKVRNTLQLVASLLSLELRSAGPSGERAALLRVQARLHSMSLVHGRSSAQGAAPSMRLDLIAAEIAEHLFPDSSPKAETVSLRTERDAVSASPQRAAPFALLVNEALMTARDSLAGRRAAGSVSLTLRALGEGACLLTVSAPADAADASESADAERQSALLMTSCASQLGAALS